MPKNIKDILIHLKKEKKADEINDYFATDFYRDFNPKDGVLGFLHEEFCDIDCVYFDSPDFEERVFKTIDKAIAMLG